MIIVVVSQYSIYIYIYQTHGAVQGNNPMKSTALRKVGGCCSAAPRVVSYTICNVHNMDITAVHHNFKRYAASRKCLYKHLCYTNV